MVDIPPLSCFFYIYLRYLIEYKNLYKTKVELKLTRKGGIIMSVEPKKKVTGKAEIVIAEFVNDKQKSHFWYGGNVATINIAKCKLYIEAVGDVFASLYDRNDPENCLEQIRDKNNQGVFGEVIQHYIENDEELQQLLNDEHPRYILKLDNNNWWECFVEYSNEHFDLMWDLQATYLDEAIEEVLTALEEGVEAGEVVVQLEK